MARKKFVDLIRFFQGYILSRQRIDDPSYTDNRSINSTDRINSSLEKRQVSFNYAAKGSTNVLFTGQARSTPFKGVTQQSGVGGTFYSPVSGGVAGLTIPPP